MKILIVVDMQNDFVSMALGTSEAQTIVSAVVKKIEECRTANDVVVFTKDTHYENYMETLEGEKLPVPHCIVATEGWHIIPEIEVKANEEVISKNTFEYDNWIRVLDNWIDTIDEIEIRGLCTDICVISNAMGLKTVFPETVISVDAACCAGVTKESHENALASMKMCQIQIKNSH